MKIVCDACQAKYSIADEKVQGKAFKIRCKKCGHIIVVKSERAAAGAAAEPKAAPAEDQGTWYVVVEGEQVGPLAEPDIAGRLARGEITGDTLVWKDGLADWVKLSTVPELSAASAAQPTPAPAKPVEHAPARRESARMRAQGAAREPAKATAEDIFSQPAAAASGSGDLFGSPAIALAPPAAEPPAAASTPFSFGAAAAPVAEPVAKSPGNGAGQSHLTAQRNENSVLFSLSNLEALAVPSAGGSGRAPSSSGSTEGSGLIDIRAMAARTIGETGRGDTFGGSDSLPTFSTPQFSPVAPVLLPMAPSGPPKWVYPVLAAIGLGIVALGLGIYKVVSVPPPAPPAPAPIVVPAVPAPAPVAATPSPTQAATPEPGKATTPEEKPGEDKGATEKKKPTGKAKPKGQSDALATKPDATKKPPDTATPTVVAPPKPKKGGGIDDLLDQVGTKRGGSPADAPTPKKPPAAALPPLSQSDIVSAMRAVQPKVKECFNQYKVPGIANVSLAVAKGGRVSSAVVTGKLAGTPTGACVESAAKSAKFPPCEAMSFPWPFPLR
jgi:predicted Zn finger-like uncharacterized protein